MGYKTTHVANAYYEPVFVKVDTERAHIKSISANANLGAEGKFSVGGGFSLEQVWNKFIEVGFAKIIPREVGSFSPDGSTVYITIWCQSQGFIWGNIPQRQDISFIVKTNGAVVKSKYGKIWQDEYGNNIKPLAQDVERAKAAAGSASFNYGINHYTRCLLISLISLLYIQSY